MSYIPDYDAHITGQVIRSIRREQGLSQEVLSGFAGIARSHLAMIETGAKSPNMETLWRIADAVNLSPSDLIKRIELEHIAKRNGSLSDSPY